MNTININSVATNVKCSRFITNVMAHGGEMLKHRWHFVDAYVSEERETCSFCGKKHLKYVAIIANEHGELAKVGMVCVYTLCGDSELFNEIKSTINKLRRETYKLAAKKKRFMKRKFVEKLGAYVCELKKPKATVTIIKTRDSYSVSYKGKVADTFNHHKITSLEMAKEAGFELYNQK